MDSESPDVETRDLVAFVRVAEAGSFRAAATRMFVSQPTLTRSIARLESAVEARLFERGPRGTKLTPEGRRLLRDARAVLGLLSTMSGSDRTDAIRTLRLGTAATAAGSFLARFFAHWIPSHPNIRIQVIEDGAARLAGRLLDGEVDVAIVAAPVRASLDSLPVVRIAVCAHMPTNHPLAESAEPIELSAVADYPILLNQRSFISAQLVWKEFENLGLVPRVVYESAVGQTLGALAEAGLGVAIYSDSVDLRATSLARRPLIYSDGTPITFDLRAAWRPTASSTWIEEFAQALSRFTAA